MKAPFANFLLEFDILPGSPRTHWEPSRPAEVVYTRGWRTEGRKGKRELTPRRLDKITEGNCGDRIREVMFEADEWDTETALSIAVDRMIDEAEGGHSSD